MATTASNLLLQNVALLNTKKNDLRQKNLRKKELEGKQTELDETLPKAKAVEASETEDVIVSLENASGKNIDMGTDANQLHAPSEAMEAVPINSSASTAMTTAPLNPMVLGGGILLATGFAFGNGTSSTLSYNPTASPTSNAPSTPLLVLSEGSKNGVSFAEATSATGVMTVTAEKDSVITLTMIGLKGSVTRTYAASGEPQNIVLTSDVISLLGDGAIDATVVAQNSSGKSSDKATAVFHLDSLAPTLHITSDRNLLRPGEKANLLFSFSEAPEGFVASDVSVSGGRLSGWTTTADPKVYTAVLTASALTINTPISIIVEAGSYGDMVGNPGVVSMGPNITLDPQAPTLAISADKTSLKSGEVAQLTFTFSEQPIGFSLEDVQVTNGSLINFRVTSDPKIFTATFVPLAGLTEAVSSTSVAMGNYSDAASNAGIGTVGPAITIDTLSPNLVISSDKTTVKTNRTATITFTFTEVVADFQIDDVVVVNGALTELQVTADPKIYTALFNPDPNVSLGTATITVNPDRYLDVAGNAGTLAASLTMQIGNVPPSTNIIPLYINDNAGWIQTKDVGAAPKVNGEFIHYADGGSYYRPNSLSSTDAPTVISEMVTDDPTPEFNGLLSTPASQGDTVVVYSGDLSHEMGRVVLNAGDIAWKVQTTTPFAMGDHNLLFAYFDADGTASVGSTLPVTINNQNYSLNKITVVPTAPLTPPEDGSVGTNALTTYINAVTGSDIVSDTELDAGFSITGKFSTSTVTDLNKLKFFLDSDRTSASTAIELGTELIHGNSGVSITTNATSGEYTITFAPNSVVLNQANQTFNTTAGTAQGGSGVHKISLSYDSAGDGHTVGVSDTSGDVIASRVFLVAAGTADIISTNNTGSAVTGKDANFSVLDPISGKVFVYYHGDPDGSSGLGSLWTQADPYRSSAIPNRSTAGEGTIFAGDWDYWSSSTANTTAPTAADYALGLERINLPEKTWEFAALKPGTAANWAQSQALAENHSATGSNTSRLATLDEAVALYAANFGTTNGSFAGTRRVVDAYQPLTEISNADSAIVNAEWNSPSGWNTNHLWTQTPSISGYAVVSFNGSVVSDQLLSSSTFAAPLIIA